MGHGFKHALGGYLDQETADALFAAYEKWKAAKAGPKPRHRPEHFEAIALRKLIVQAESLLRAHKRPSRIKRIAKHFGVGRSYVKKTVARAKGL